MCINLLWRFIFILEEAMSAAVEMVAWVCFMLNCTFSHCFFGI